MSVADLLRTVRAHLVVFGVCILLILAGSAGVYLTVPVKYEAKTQMVLLSPSNQRNDKGEFVPVNPFLLAGDRPAQVTASAMGSIATSTRFQDELTASGVTSEATVAVSTGGGGVVLDVSAINGDADKARGDLAALREKLETYLKDRQVEAGAPTTQLYRFADLIGDDQASKLPGDRSKLTMVAGALGLALTLLVVVLLSGLDRRRKSGGAADGIDMVPEADLAPARPAPVAAAPVAAPALAAPVLPASVPISYPSPVESATERIGTLTRVHPPQPEPAVRASDAAPRPRPRPRPAPAAAEARPRVVVNGVDGLHGSLPSNGHGHP